MTAVFFGFCSFAFHILKQSLRLPESAILLNGVPQAPIGRLAIPGKSKSQAFGMTALRGGGEGVVRAAIGALRAWVLALPLRKTLWACMPFRVSTLWEPRRKVVDGRGNRSAPGGTQ